MKNIEKQNKANNKFNHYPIVSFKTFHALDTIINKENRYIPTITPIPGAETALNNLSDLLTKCKPYYMNSLDQHKPLLLQQSEWMYKVRQNVDLQNLSLAIKELTNPLISISQLWTSNYSNMLDKIRQTIIDLQRIPAFDFSKVNKQFKEACLIMLKNGYYPTRRISIEIVKIAKIKNNKQLNEFICNKIENIIKRDKKRIKNYLKKYNKIITQIFKLYDTHDYRLCILSIINLLSIIYNSTFDNTDFTEAQLKEKLKNLGLLTDSQAKYSIFAPYYVDAKYNKILASYRYKKEMYKKYPYCRNAILHGYSKKFGNKRNALRWFSVLLNTIDLLEAIEKTTN